jgi:RNA-directed DNA polymerase
MLTALEMGVRGGKWHSLMDKVYHRTNLEAAVQQVSANRGAPGVDHIRTEDFAERQDANLDHLQAALRAGNYRPQDVKRVWIPKPGSKEQRPLGIPTVRDRVVQTALRNVIEPIFERDFAEHSYGFRPGRGCKDALRRVAQLLQAGHRYVVDADLKSYFDTIDHELLRERIKKKISDGRVLALIEQFLKQGVLDQMSRWTPEAGSPQGAVVSPLLSNIFLDPLDHLMAELGFEMVRYADDFVILCQTAEAAQAALALVQEWAADNQLTLHPVKTRIVDAGSDGFDFLGYTFHGPERWPRKKSLQKLKDTLRQKTKRTRGGSLPVIVEDLNRTLRGWFEYFKHRVRRPFPVLDRWLRMRLRSILRHRAGRTGRGRGWDHLRWPNAYFAAHGLLNLQLAHAAACQSSRRG